jgi:hypothetical protein
MEEQNHLPHGKEAKESRLESHNSLQQSTLDGLRISHWVVPLNVPSFSNSATLGKKPSTLGL